MDTLEIRTPHNVALSLRLAGGMPRVLAFGMDQFFLVAFITIYFVSVYLVWPSWAQSEFFEVIIPYSAFAVYFFYSLCFENLWNGQTPGKRIMSIRVRREDGSTPVFMDYLIRWIFRIPDIVVSAGTLAFLMVSASQKKQRLGDLLAGTVVVMDDRKVQMPLSRILSIKDQEDYSPNYPLVTRLKETDVVTLKELVTRAHAHPKHEVYQKLAAETANRMKEILEITETPASNLKFLKDIVREFVVLTR
jgi:uncharacterized RDD family membrane protein YckC